jgi:hypothetical protein
MARSHPLGLSSILSSEARFLVLQVLASLPSGLKLRELERATELGIRSVQVATEGLLAEQVLSKNHLGLFQLNQKSAQANKVKKMFNFLRDEEIREGAQILSKRAKQIVRLSEEVAQFVNKGRAGL